MQLTKIKNLIEQNKSGAGELAVVEGLHAIKHALRFNAQPEIIVTRDKEELLKLTEKLCTDLTKQLKDLVQEIGEEFDNLTNSQIRTGVLGLFYKPKTSVIGRPEHVIVLLDDPRDLDNIGAAVRVCAAAGVKELILTGDSNPWNSRAIRAAAGLQFALIIKQTTVAEILETKLPLISFDERGELLDLKLKTKIPARAIYVFGSERDGISKQIKENSTKIICLPMQEGVSSMNLATSVAAALYSLN